MPQSVRLDKLDKAILYVLDSNSRTPASRISSLLKVSKERVLYRINKLVADGVIEKFLMVTDLALLGHASYKVYLQLQNADSKVEEAMVKYLIANQRVGFMARCEGKYDLLFALLVRSPEDFNAQLEAFLAKFSKHVKGYDMTITLSGETFPRKYLLTEERRPFKVATWGKTAGVAALDELDLRILKSLGENCRKSALEIAKEAQTSGDTVLKRMKRLEQSGIIQAYKIQLNKQKFGYRYYKLFLNLAPMDEKKETAMLAYFKEHPHVVFALKTLGRWNCELDIELPAEEQFYGMVRKMRDDLGDALLSYESVHCYEEPKFNYMEIDTAILPAKK